MSTDFAEVWSTGPNAIRFYCRIWEPTEQPPRAAVIFLHGFIEHIGRYEHVFAVWKRRGIYVFAFDQRGFGWTATDVTHRSKDSSFGKTSGRDQREDIEWAIKFVKGETKNSPLFLMGHSMGGARALDFVTQQTIPTVVSSLSGVLVTAPFILQPIPAPLLFKWFVRWAALALPNLVIPAQPFIHPEDVSRDPHVVNSLKKDPLYRRRASLRAFVDLTDDGESLLKNGATRWIVDLPILMLHGTSDKVASYSGTEQFYKTIEAKDKTLISYPNAYHELCNESDGVKEKWMEDCISWIENHLEQAHPTAPDDI